ncbi:unnamed protein product [Pleuronectes platessa]|uniref:Uncharacterized protein n=1 Tax=Pleuronectes platessa TaxID=8262 RepID=A0A9N7U4E9_PLEPL|nr:unnamed protein product [Pleuronectes platessa]
MREQQHMYAGDGLYFERNHTLTHLRANAPSPGGLPPHPLSPWGLRHGRVASEVLDECIRAPYHHHWGGTQAAQRDGARWAELFASSISDSFYALSFVRKNKSESVLAHGKGQRTEQASSASERPPRCILSHLPLPLPPSSPSPSLLPSLSP